MSKETKGTHFFSESIIQIPLIGIKNISTVESIECFTNDIIGEYLP